MAGGTFISMNKIRPGAYVNIVANKKFTSRIGERGTVAVPIILGWGAESEITKVTVQDMIDGTSIKLIGTDGTDADSLSVQLALAYADTALLYRVNASGVKASATIGNLEVEAKYTGTFGNKIAVSIVANDTKYDVITTVEGKVKDKQTVSTIAELVANDFVEFDGTGALATNAGTLLTGGTNGTVGASAYTNFLASLDTYDFNCLAMASTVLTDANATITKIAEYREKGKYVQGVIIDTTANNEGLIAIKQALKMGDTTISKSNVAILVASMTAGASVTESNTYKKIDGVTEIVDSLTDSQIIEALENGYFVFSLRQDGAIVVEKDINTLHEYNSTRSNMFSKNRVIRTIDEIARTLCLDFETNYIGKVTNNEKNRSIYKTSVMNVLKQFAQLECIDPVGTDEVEVLAGQDIDSVILNLSIKPADSMEKLYVTLNIN